MFTKNSALTKIWVSMVLNGTYHYSDVPKLSNLRDCVGQVLVEMGYDINNETPTV